MLADGTSQRKAVGNELTPPEAACFAWVPDGERLLFLSSGDLYSVRWDGTEFQALTAGARIQSPFSLSPDLKYVAYATNLFSDPPNQHGSVVCVAPLLPLP
jgi:Tol biopolymer transport system component